MNGSVIFDEARLRKAVKQHGQNVVKAFSASVFKDIVKSSPQKDTMSASGAYRRTGTLRDGWDIKKASRGYMILNEVKYAIYYEYGHRLRGGGILKGEYLMSKAVDKNLKKFGLTATRKGGI